MKKITILLFMMLLAFSWQSNAQSTINVTTSGGSFSGEKWVSITTEADGGGTLVWGQGATQCEDAGLINLDIDLAPGTYYVNCYDQYDDSWDGTLISVTAYGAIIGNNGGVTPDDGEDTDLTSSCEGTPEELEASFEIVVPLAPTCVGPTTLTATGITGSTADLAWTEAGTATLWNVEIVDAGVAATGNATASGVTNPYTAMGLTQNTDFEFYVQSDCGMSDVSPWIGPFAFSTIASSAPDCPVVIGTPDATCGNFDSNLSWAAVTGADSYAVSVGTSSGDVDIADNVDVGTDLTYDFAGTSSTTYYYTVTATNSAGTSTSCTEASFTTEAGLCYCDPSSTNVNVTTFIDNVSTTGASMDLSNLASGLSTDHYDDNFATMGVTSFADGSFDFTVEIEGGTLGLAIWIDWNNDSTYEVSENVFTTTGYGNGPFTGTITIPTATANGDYHMRIMADWNDNNPGDDDACSLEFGRGETEDYKVTVADAPACTPPTAITNTVLTDTAADFTWAGTETVWEYANLLSPSTEPTSGTSTMTGTASFTGLTPETDYDFYVRSDCGGTFSAWGLVSYTTLATPPVNDDIANATTISIGEMICDGNTNNGTNVAATDSGEGAGDCFVGGAGSDVWYTFTLTSDDIVTVSTDYTGGTLTDSQIAIFSGTSGALVQEDCDQDSGSTTLSNGSAFNSIIEDLDLTAGTYYVQVSGYNGQVGTFCLSLDAQSLSVDTVQNEATFTYYPNPVKNTLTLNAQKTIEQVAMYNMLGQEVLRATPNALASDLDMSNLQTGTYFVKVTIANVTETIRVIKQ